MWSRSDLKNRAKEALAGSYWQAFLVSIILAIVTGSSNGSSGRGGANVLEVNFGDFSYAFIPIMIFAFLAAVAIGLSLKIFLGYPLEVGGRRYFVRASQKEVDLGYLGYAFNKDHYINVVKAMLYRGVLIFLWFLLLIIPGIVKSYAYSMVPYILSDNSKLGHKRALELSNQMTNGEKMDMFILDLSFLGWFVLGVLTFGIGLLFVLPYYNSTRAELYLVLRKKALETGLCSYEELSME